jgi:hypothetical protein
MHPRVACPASARVSSERLSGLRARRRCRRWAARVRFREGRCRGCRCPMISWSERLGLRERQDGGRCRARSSPLVSPLVLRGGQGARSRSLIRWVWRSLNCPTLMPSHIPHGISPWGDLTVLHSCRAISPTGFEPLARSDDQFTPAEAAKEVIDRLRRSGRKVVSDEQLKQFVGQKR